MEIISKLKAAVLMNDSNGKMFSVTVLDDGGVKNITCRNVSGKQPAIGSGTRQVYDIAAAAQCMIRLSQLLELKVSGVRYSVSGEG
jgi:hypothetical protein